MPYLLEDSVDCMCESVIYSDGVIFTTTRILISDDDIWIREGCVYDSSIFEYGID